MTKIKCYMCNGLGATHEVVLLPNDPEEWWEDCRECAGKGKVDISLLDYFKSCLMTFIFNIKGILYRLKHKDVTEDNEIPF